LPDILPEGFPQLVHGGKTLTMMSGTARCVPKAKSKRSQLARPAQRSQHLLLAACQLPNVPSKPHCKLDASKRAQMFN